jgi:hypothetical protein
LNNIKEIILNYLEKGNFNEAKQFTEKIKDPSEKFNTYGVISFYEKDLKKAKLFFKKSLEINPENVDAIINISKILFLEGNTFESLSYLYKIKEKDKDVEKIINEIYETTNNKWMSKSNLNKIITKNYTNYSDNYESLFEEIINKIDSFFVENEFRISNNYLLYPFIRFTLLSIFFNKIFNFSIKGSSIKSKKYQRIPKSIFEKIKNKHFDYVFITHSTLRVKSKNNKFINRIHDYYANIFPNSSLELEFSNNGEYYYPTYFENVLPFDEMLKNVSITFDKYNNLENSKKVLLDYSKNINNFLNQNFKKIISLNEEYLFKIINNINSQIIIFEEEIRNILKFLNPKIVFVHCGYYGQIYSLIIKIAKDLGIQTAEIQHGFFGKINEKYYFSEKLLKYNEYLSYTPDYFLTFGDFWKDLVKIPSKVFTLGNPHFWKNLKKIRKIGSPKNKIILIASQGTLTHKYVNLAKELARKLPQDYLILFKLHPLEIGFKNRYSELYNYENIRVIKKGDIYNILAISNYLISIYSTTIFEAVSLGIPTFILDNEISRFFIPKDIGIWVSNVDEIIEYILKEKDYFLFNSNNIEFFFKKNWKNNYKNFISKIFSSTHKQN